MYDKEKTLSRIRNLTYNDAKEKVDSFNKTVLDKAVEDYRKTGGKVVNEDKFKSYISKKIKDQLINIQMEKKTFIFVTRDFCSEGFAMPLVREGCAVIFAYKYYEEDGKNKEDDKKRKESLDILCEGIIPKFPLEKVWAKRESFKNAYWIFDQNHLFKEGEQLRKEGFQRVFGGYELSYKMEHDREFGVSLVEKVGLKSPPTFNFNDINDGIDHMELNPEIAYIFKPNSDDAGWKTYVPDSDKDSKANEELCRYVGSLDTGNSKGFVLQERKKGVEVNFELWLHKGKPYFAVADLESKRKLNDDLGPLVGGAQDIAFKVSLDCRGVKETVNQLLKLNEFKNYTGFLDMNVIIGDEIWFLEFCARWGYPEHPTVFTSLKKDSSKLSDILSEMMDGKKLDKFYDFWRDGFASGVTMYNEHPQKGLPIYYPEEDEGKIFFYDLYRENDECFLAGVEPEICIATGHGYSTKDSAEAALSLAKKISFPQKGHRTDLDKDNYFSNSHDRYIALQSMKFI